MIFVANGAGLLLEAESEEVVVAGGEVKMGKEGPPSLVPPPNFAMVDAGVYRSGFRLRRTSPSSTLSSSAPSYICVWNRTLILMLNSSDHTWNSPVPVWSRRVEEEVFSCIPKDQILEALQVLLDVRNHPLLIHCKRGKFAWGRHLFLKAIGIARIVKVIVLLSP